MESRTTTRAELVQQPTALVQTALLENAVKELRLLRRHGHGQGPKPR